MRSCLALDWVWSRAANRADRLGTLSGVRGRGSARARRGWTRYGASPGRRGRRGPASGSHARRVGPDRPVPAAHRLDHLGLETGTQLVLDYSCVPVSALLAASLFLLPSLFLLRRPCSRKSRGSTRTPSRWRRSSRVLGSHSSGTSAHRAERSTEQISDPDSESGQVRVRLAFVVD